MIHPRQRRIGTGDGGWHGGHIPHDAGNLHIALDGVAEQPHQYLSAQRGGAVDGVGIVGHHAAQGGAGHGHRHADLRLTADGPGVVGRIVEGTDEPRDQQGVLLLRLGLAQPFSDAVYRRRDDAGGPASGHTDDGAVGVAELHDAHGVQTRLIGGPQIDELPPLPQSLIAGGTGVGDTDKVVVRADALLPCMAADIQHLPGVGPQLRLRGAGEGTFIVESHPPQRTPGVTGKGKHLLCRAEGDSPFLLGEGEQRL